MSIHGGNIIATAKELSCSVTDLIDMSSNLTPLGMVPGLNESLVAGLNEISYLPEMDSETLRRIFARKYDLKEDEVFVGNGTTEFIFALPTAFAGNRAIIVNPTYSDYRLACKWANVSVTDFNLILEEDFLLDLDRLAGEFRGGELVFICNPNNPTGRLIDNNFLYKLITDNADTFFLVDESYLPFTREKSLLEYDLPANLFILCSSSKIYGIPGLRLGFLVARSENLRKFSGQRKPWGVNRMAQLAGEYLLQHGDDYVEEVRCFLESERPPFVQALAELKDIHVIEGRANFILCYLKGVLLAPVVREKLLEKRIMIRNCVTFDGLNDHYFRMSLKGSKGNMLCLDALREIL